MKAAQLAPMRFHGVAGESAINYSYYEGIRIIAKHLHEENSRSPPHKKRGILNFKSLFTFLMDQGIQWILPLAGKNFKNL
jgi:hypothetical protein